MFTLPDFNMLDSLGKKLTDHIDHVEKTLATIDEILERVMVDLDELKISQKIIKHIVQDKLK